MQMNRNRLIVVMMFVIAIIVAQTSGFTQKAPDKAAFKQEELDQLLAPIALYPDSLLSQILMASTYPLEIVQAQRWATANKDLKGDALAKALETQTWDPSVKSLINFPQVLGMMNEKLDWTQKMGDAFLSQQEDVLKTVQTLRKKAQEEGNLKTTSQQKVVVEKETIVITSASPQVVYVPTYNPTVVYGVWAYPSYPPYYYYPPAYVPAPGLAFATGVAIGAAWGYAWGNCNWHGGNVDIDVNRNVNVNHNINRGNYASHYGGAGQGSWSHNPAHRAGVPYSNQRTASQYNRAGTTQATQARDNYRGRTQTNQGDFNRSNSSGGGAFQGTNTGRSAEQFSNRGQSSRSTPSGSGWSGGGSSGGGRSGGGSGWSGGGGGGGGRSGGGGGRSGGGGRR